MTAGPAQRTLELLRKEGWMAEMTEYWTHRPAGPDRETVTARTIHGQRVTLGPVRSGPPLWIRANRRDLWGFGDVLAMREGALLLVQATTTDNQAARVRKITRDCAEAARLWLSTGARCEVWGWKRYEKAVSRRLWRETRTPITMEDFR